MKFINLRVFRILRREKNGNILLEKRPVYVCFFFNFPSSQYLHENDFLVNFFSNKNGDDNGEF